MARYGKATWPSVVPTPNRPRGTTPVDSLEVVHLFVTRTWCLVDGGGEFPQRGRVLMLPLQDIRVLQATSGVERVELVAV
jgi:hypothetical protein